jgi:putative Mn2+ efflux pump MntP
MQSAFDITILAFALAFDAFAVAVAVGLALRAIDKWSVFRLSWHFGFAQFGMPLIGWRAGALVSGLLGSVGSWVAGAILLILGVRLIWEQIRPEVRRWEGDPTRGAALILLMFATSVDALAAGLSLALVGTDILLPALVIGIVAAAMTVVGLVFGHKLGSVSGRAAGIVGGIVLIALAIKTAMF